jgi:hypothetical protein
MSIPTEMRQQGIEALRRQADARAEQLAPILDEIASTGITSAYGTARALNKRGIPTPRGGHWTGSSVTRLRQRLERMRR